MQSMHALQMIDEFKRQRDDATRQEVAAVSSSTELSSSAEVSSSASIDELVEVECQTEEKSVTTVSMQTTPIAVTTQRTQTRHSVRSIGNLPILHLLRNNYITIKMLKIKLEQDSVVNSICCITM